jgi:hypothetical protein
MTVNRSDLLAATAHKCMMKAQELIDAGFCTKAAQQSALQLLNRAYSNTNDIVHDLVITHARAAVPGWDKVEDHNDPLWVEYRSIIDAHDLPFDLHQVRPVHVERAAALAPASAQIMQELVNMRAVAKATPITPMVKDETKVRVAAVRASLIEEMARRKAQYVEALDMARQFNGLPVSVNAHWVRHEQGTMFLRHYFYLRGKITPLQVLLAAADTHAREQAAAL